MRRHYVFLFQLFVFYSTSAHALALDNFLRTVWQNSEQLKGKNEQSELASGDRWRRFIPNEPQASFISQDNGGWQQASLSLTIPFPGRPLLMTSPDASRARAANHDLAATKLELTRSASDVFLDCASGKRAFEIQQKNLQDMQTFSRSLDKLYERGHSTQAETLAAKLQLRQLESDVGLTESRGRVLCERVKTFAPLVSPEETYELPEDLDTKFVAELGENTAESLRAQGQAESAAAQRDSAIWKNLPDFTVSVFHNRYFVTGSSPVGLPQTYSIQATVNLPVFFLFNELPDSRKQLADAQVQRDQSDIAARLARSAQQQAGVEFRAISKRLTALDKEDIPMAEAMIESGLSSYRSGRIGFAELMLSRRIYNDLRNQKLQLQVNRLQLRLRCLSRCETESP